MSLIPDEELKKTSLLNFAPMVDFLFVIVAVFATTLVTRTILHDREIDLAQLSSEQKALGMNQPYVVHISITEQGKYKWMTEVNEFLMASTEVLQKELQKQQQLGLIPSESEQVKILLHIDKRAQWEPVAEAIFAMREQGFLVHPVYQP